MKKNVLVFPCGSEIGLEIYRSLNQSTHFTLYGGSSVDDHGKYIYENYIDAVPLVDDSNFTSVLNKIIKKYNIEYIFPAHDSVVLKLAEEFNNGNLGCKVITSKLSTCIIARSKLLTYKELSSKISVPKIFNEISEIKTDDLPIFLKPDVGQGSKGTYLAKDIQEVKFYLRKDPTLLLLEYLPGDEFTIDCFTDKNGELRVCMPRVRRRTSNGISVNSEEVVDNKFKEIALIINNTLLFRGVWFFQLKSNTKGDLVLLEVAPRVAGTMALTRSMGVNLPLLSLFDAQNLDIEISANDYSMVIDRALENKFKHNIKYNHVYLDFDDLVIYEEKINISVMAFVFQCINNGVSVHLITKHKHELNETLLKHRLSSVFDEIIWLRNGEEKYTFIKYKDSIFIDDSYSERLAVQKKCNIPVFDSHMIESLMS